MDRQGIEGKKKGEGYQSDFGKFFQKSVKEREGSPFKRCMCVYILVGSYHEVHFPFQVNRIRRMESEKE